MALMQKHWLASAAVKMQPSARYARVAGQLSVACEFVDDMQD